MSSKLEKYAFKISEICRVCLEKCYTGGISLEENENIELLEFCFGLSMKLQRSPKLLCSKCTEIVQGYANFKRKCMEAEEYWKSYSNNYNPVFIPRVEIKVEHHKESILASEVDIDNSKLLTNRRKHETKLIMPFQCQKCKKSYSKQSSLLKHMKKYCANKKNKNVNKPIDYPKIIESKNNESPSSTCGLCDKDYDCDLKSHLNEHYLNNDLKCRICSFAGRDFADMTTHRFRHCSDKKLYCHICDRKKASVLSLQFHYRAIHLQKAGGLCSVCNKSFTKFKTWKRHERLHNENSLFICGHCERRFVFRHEIKTHLIHHTDVRQFVCEACGKGFKRMWGLKDHIENIHSEIQPVTCEHCSKTYKSQTKLDLHLRNIAKEKPFVCDVCSKKFVTEKVLKKHMFWHTGERPYSCEVCGSKYKAKGQLNLHMRNHTGIMPYKCVDCGKSFPNSFQLKRHRSVHTGVRAHKCDKCERSFHEKKAFLEHASLHHSNDSVKLET